MPSPVGHMLGGLAAGRLVAGRTPFSAPADPAASRRTARTQLLIFAVLGALPDIDFLLGMHSTYTHSVGATLLIGLAVALIVRQNRVLLGLAAASAYGSHVLLDWMGNDTTPPIGIMALWPFTDAYYQSNLYWFMAISRRYWLANFWTHNLTAVLWEVALLGPFVVLVEWARRRTKQDGEVLSGRKVASSRPWS